MESRNLIGGLLAGAAIGVAVGMLLAPRSGDDSRKKIVRGSKGLIDDLRTSMEDGIDSLKNQFKGAVEETAKRGKESLLHGANGAKEAINYASDKVKS